MVGPMRNNMIANPLFPLRSKHNQAAYQSWKTIDLLQRLHALRLPGAAGAYKSEVLQNICTHYSLGTDCARDCALFRTSLCHPVLLLTCYT